MMGLPDLLDCDWGPASLVGHLANDRGQIRFLCDKAWLSDPRALALDPDWFFDRHPFFPRPELGMRHKLATGPGV